jgi:hypothetical protein
MKKEPYYWTCPFCGANSDPGESCDCQQQSTDEHRIPMNNYRDVNLPKFNNIKPTPLTPHFNKTYETKEKKE